MEKFIFTMDELERLDSLIFECSQYVGTYDTPEVYDDFLENLFGKDWNELIGEWDDLYLMEGRMDFYLQVIKGHYSESLKHWESQGKELLQQILEESKNSVTL